jgi:hypothetical protein
MLQVLQIMPGALKVRALHTLIDIRKEGEGGRGREGGGGNNRYILIAYNQPWRLTRGLTHSKNIMSCMSLTYVPEHIIYILDQSSGRDVFAFGLSASHLRTQGQAPTGRCRHNYVVQELQGLEIDIKVTVIQLESIVKLLDTALTDSAYTTHDKVYPEVVNNTFWSPRSHTHRANII